LPFAKSRSRPDRSQRKAKLHKRIVFTNYAVPTGNLDKENRRKIVELLQQIAHEQDRCVIVVTHSDYVKKKCDICYEMGDDDEE
jgi:putative ABC transport system ATP-binding protein